MRSSPSSLTVGINLRPTQNHPDGAEQIVTELCVCTDADLIFFFHRIFFITLVPCGNGIQHVNEVTLCQAWLHCVSKKDTTQPPTIISTIVVRFQSFLVRYKYCWVNMPSKGGLIYHLTCFLWSPYVIGQTIIFSSCFFFFFLLLLFFPRLISAVGNWMFTILWHMMWP